jgi:hypothetical protein
MTAEDNWNALKSPENKNKNKISEKFQKTKYMEIILGAVLKSFRLKYVLF